MFGVRSFYVECAVLSAERAIKNIIQKLPCSNNREFKQIATAGAATAIVVKEVWGEYFAVARQNSTLSNAKYK